MTENELTEKPSLANTIGYIVSMSFLFIVIGLIISTQTKKHIEAKEAIIPAGRQLNELVLLLKEAQLKKADLEKQLVNLRQQVHKIEKKDLPPSLSSSQFQKLYQIAGLTPVKGAGITIKLDDQKPFNHIPSEENSSENDILNNDGYVRSDDLLNIVNELKASGAKAISINNQRIVTTSEIVTAGNSIMLNQTRLIPPYIIKALGPSETMSSALKMRGGIVECLEVFGIKITIESKPNITIPAYTGSLS